MGNAISKVLVKRAYATLREYIPDTIDEQSWFWPRVEASLRYLAYRAQKTRSTRRLESALKEKGGECVIIPRQPPNKLGMDNGCTHVLTTRVFRYCWLRGPHQLKSIQNCSNGFGAATTSDFCINPYHYAIDRDRMVTITIERNRFVWPAEGIADHADEQFVRNFDFDPNCGLGVKKDENLVEISSPMSKIVIRPEETPLSEQDHDVGLDPRAPQAAADHGDAARPTDGMAADRGTAGDHDVGLDPRAPQAAADHGDAARPTDGVAADRGTAGGTSPVVLLERGALLNISIFERNVQVCNDTEIRDPECSIRYEENSTNEETEPNMIIICPNSSDERNTHKSIGKGLCMFYVDGEIIVDNRSPGSIFIQSKYVNDKLEKAPTSVIEINKYSAVVIWSDEYFAAKILAASSIGYHEVKKLEKWTRFTVSFGKFGSGKGIEFSGKCYVACTMLRIQKVINKTLKAMGRPY